MTDKERIDVSKYMIGSWYWSGKEITKNNVIERVFNVQYEVIITEDKLTVHKGVENIFSGAKPISSSCHWFEDCLIFLEEQKYFVKYADEEVLVFGEMKSRASFGDVRWEQRFKRAV